MTWDLQSFLKVKGRASDGAKMVPMVIQFMTPAGPRDLTTVILDDYFIPGG